METVKFQSGDVIFEEGAEENWMYEIRKGTVGIYAEYGVPEARELTSLGRGAFLGELGLISGRARSASATALEDVELLRISAADFSDYVMEHPDKVLGIMRQMADRLQDLTDDYMEACRTISEMKEDEEDEAPGLMERIARYTGIFRNRS